MPASLASGRARSDNSDPGCAPSPCHTDIGMIALLNMSKSQVKKRRGGAPQKVPGGLDRALFVRANEDLLAKLEELRESRSRAAGVTLSKADVARQLIAEAIAREEEPS